MDEKLISEEFFQDINPDFWNGEGKSHLPLMKEYGIMITLQK